MSSYLRNFWHLVGVCLRNSHVCCNCTELLTCHRTELLTCHRTELLTSLLLCARNAPHRLLQLLLVGNQLSRWKPSDSRLGSAWHAPSLFRGATPNMLTSLPVVQALAWPQSERPLMVARPNTIRYNRFPLARCTGAEVACRWSPPTAP